MKTLLIVFLAAASLVAFSGCNRSSAETVSAIPETKPAAHYKAGHGLQLTPIASEFIGLKTGEVGSRDIGETKSVPAVPIAALLRTVKGDFVYVSNGGWLLRTQVKIGSNDGAWFEVKDGLYEGDSIVTHGTQALWMAELQAVNGGVGCADGH
jgi:hypothetical protein